jgi:hypothetical protein
MSHDYVILPTLPPSDTTKRALLALLISVSELGETKHARRMPTDSDILKYEAKFQIIRNPAPINPHTQGPSSLQTRRPIFQREKLHNIPDRKEASIRFT